MTHTRRDLLKFAGGAAAGALLTPAPWRLITDTALWSETWPGVPRVARGEIRARFTNCTLCPAGCAVRARCVGDQPVALAGVAGHPFTHGALCAFGLAGHHLPYHPARVKSGPVKEAAAAISSSIARCKDGERIALLDLRPGRTASWTFRRALAKWQNGTYLVPPQAAGNTAVNLAEAKTVLSFGVPMLDGWGTPGNVLAARDGFHLIQAETVESRTAAMADEWLAIAQGGEAALATALANALSGTPIDSSATGLSAERIAAVARQLRENGPALVLDSQECMETLALNQLLGSLGRTIVARHEAPVPAEWQHSAAPVTAWDAVPDRSIRILLIDESSAGVYIPWSVLEKKLAADNPVVAVFTSSREGYGQRAEFVLPAAVYPELTDDIPAPVDSPAAMFRLSTPLVAPPGDMVEPAQFVASLAGISAEHALRERADAIHKAGHGTLYRYADEQSVAVTDLKAVEFWKALNDGASWTDSPARLEAPHPVALAHAVRPVEDDLPLFIAFAETRVGPGSPLLSKLYQESNLRLTEHRVVLHPDTARSSGVPDGGKAVLATHCGKLEVEVVVDVSTPPGVVQAACGARMLDLCGDSPWAKVVRI